VVTGFDYSLNSDFQALQKSGSAATGEIFTCGVFHKSSSEYLRYLNIIICKTAKNNILT
jgi:hypothetical protein